MSHSSSKKGTASVQFLTITAVCIALVYVFTVFVNIRLPISVNGGLIHLGNVPLFICAILFGKKTGAIAGGVGMALFDITSSYTAWAPFTFIIVGLMGYLVGLITEKSDKLDRIIIAMIVALLVKIVGYYFAEVIMYGNWVAPFTSIPGNLIQVGVAAIITIVCMPALRKATRQMFNQKW